MYDSIFEKNCEQYLSFDAGTIRDLPWQKKIKACDYSA
jgi:hypothetical protein